MANEITVEGMNRLLVGFKTGERIVSEAARKGMAKGGMQIIADAQRNMRTAGHNGGTLNNTGRLSQSGRVQRIQGDSDAIDVGFFSDSAQSGYAAYVEYGTRAHWAPSQEIRAWVRKKLRVAEDKVRSVAFMVNRKMSRTGTRPHPFFSPAVETNKENVSRYIAEEVQAMTKHDL